MKIGALKKLIADIPDNVEVCITDMENFSSDFELSTYDDGSTYVDMIMPKYIIEYSIEDSEETYFSNC